MLINGGLQVKVPNRELLKIYSKMELSSSQQLIEADLSVAEIAQYSGKLDIQGFSSLKATAHRKGVL